MGLLDRIKQKQERTEAKMNSTDRSREEIFKATPHFYSKPNGSIFGAIALTEDTKTLLPINPKSDYKVDGMQVDEWIITFVSISQHTMIYSGDYYSMIEKLKQCADYFDDKMIIVRNMTLEEMKRMYVNKN